MTVLILYVFVVLAGVPSPENLRLFVQKQFLEVSCEWTNPAIPPMRMQPEIEFETLPVFTQFSNVLDVPWSYPTIPPVLECIDGPGPCVIIP